MRNTGSKTNNNRLEQPATNCNWTFYDNDGDNEASRSRPARVRKAIMIVDGITKSHCYVMSNKPLESKLSTFKQHNTLILVKLTGLYKLTILRLTQLVRQSCKWILRSNLTVSTGTSPCRNFHRRDCPKTKFIRNGVKLINTRMAIVASLLSDLVVLHHAKSKYGTHRLTLRHHCKNTSKKLRLKGLL